MRQLAAPLIVLLLLPQLTQAQFFINTGEDVLGEHPAFNPAFIKEHKIKSMRAEITGKKEMEVIRDWGHKEYYRFLQNGKLLMHYNTLDLPTGARDTIAWYYEYDHWGRVKVHRTNDAQGFYSHHFLYDSLGRPVKDNLYRDVNIGSRKTSFIPGGFSLIQRELCSYEENGNELKKRYYNSSGKEYKKEVSVFSTDKKLLALITSFTVSNRISKIAYSYNDNGQLIKKSSLDNWSGANELEYRYTYDKQGNLITEDKYKNSVHTTHIEYLYKEDGRFYAKLEKNVATNYIKIQKYFFKYFQ